MKLVLSFRLPSFQRLGSRLTQSHDPCPVGLSSGIRLILTDDRLSHFRRFTMAWVYFRPR